MESGRSSRTDYRCPGISQAGTGPQTLKSSVITALINYKSLLSDIGDVPIELLVPVFEAFSPGDLARVEDATAAGEAARDLKPFTWPCWYTHCCSLLERSAVCSRVTGFPRDLPPLPGASEIFLSPEAITAQREGIAVGSVDANEAKTPEAADYRSVYENLIKSVDEKREALGKRLRKMLEEHDQQRASRSIKVIPPRQPWHRNQSSQSNGKPFHNDPTTVMTSSTLTTSTSRERLAKKLGVTPNHQQGPALKKRDKQGSSLHKQLVSRGKQPKPTSSIKKQMNQKPKTECILFEDDIF